MVNPKSVSPIAKIEPRRVVATVPCPRPGCRGKITLTVGAKGDAWGCCKELTTNAGKSGKPATCQTPVSFTAVQTRALLEGARAGAASPSPEKKAMPKTIEVDDDDAAEVEKIAKELKAKRAAAAAGGDKPGDKSDAGAKPRKRVGFFEYD